jgi:hypothetical protein
MSSNILLSRLSPYIDEIIGDHQCGFRRNRPTTDQNVYINQKLETKLEYNDTVPQIFIDFKKAYYSMRREVLQNILIDQVMEVLYPSTPRHCQSLSQRHLLLILLHV